MGLTLEQLARRLRCAEGEPLQSVKPRRQRDGSRRVKHPALLFVLKATVVIGLIVLVGLSGENIASHTAQNPDAFSSQN
jgi:hypothetical protein